MQNTVHNLRKAGYKVRVIHYRYYKADSVVGSAILLSKKELKEIAPCDNRFILLPRGGKTAVEITTPSGANTFGESICSRKDGFNRKLGLKIAINRALAKLDPVGGWQQ